ncbi:hypothetical protein ACWGF2_14915 [Streptomyces sp. NPDC054919]
MRRLNGAEDVDIGLLAPDTEAGQHLERRRIRRHRPLRRFLP